MNLELVAHESRSHDMALVEPIVAVSHQEAAANEMLGALLLEPRLPREAAVFGEKLFDEVCFGEAQAWLHSVPKYEAFS